MMDFKEVFDVNKNSRLKRFYYDGYGLARVW